MTKARNIADLGSNDVIETTATGVTVTGEVVSDGLSLGDNDKATFGASDDLQIYHDGGNSFIKDTGDGILFVQGSGGVRVLGSDTSESLARFNENGSVQLYHDNAEKLATTATGVDVTGTVTADGLNVGDIAANNYSGLSGLSNMGVENADVYGYSAAEGGLVVNAKYESGWKHTQSDVATRYTQVNGDHRFYSADSGASGTTANFREVLKLDNTGDVSFYEDTGTTAKFVWDSSAESLSIGNAAGFGALRVGHVGDKVEALVIGDNTTHTSDTGIYLRSDTLGVISVGSTASLSFKTGGGSGTERARIDSSGNLLVGRTSQLGANSKLTLECNALYNDGLTLNDSYTGAGAAASINFYRNSTKVGSITNTTSSVAYNTTSDERLKENIKDTTHDVNIDDIRVREYDWKADGSHQRFGFIAQELETVYPEAVTSPKDEDEMKSVDYSKLVPLLVKEIQTLKARIETLENK